MWSYQSSTPSLILHSPLHCYILKDFSSCTGWTRQCCIIWSSPPHSQMVGSVLWPPLPHLVIAAFGHPHSCSWAVECFPLQSGRFRTGRLGLRRNDSHVSMSKINSASKELSSNFYNGFKKKYLAKVKLILTIILS